MSLDKVLQLAKEVKIEGGTLYLVGGCVRDEYLNLPSKDFDCEVYGIEPARLHEIVSKFGVVDCVGESFQVYKLGQDVDVSIPRRERKSGVGHKAFIVEGDPHMSWREACSRRDFTINAIMSNPLTGEIIDPFNGIRDLSSETIKMVSEQSFAEDSLRVLRAVQFASRFDFTIEEATFKAANSVPLDDLPKERVWMELEKMFLKSKNLSRGLEILCDLNIKNRLFPSFPIKISLTFKDVIDRIALVREKLSKGELLALTLAVIAQSTKVDIIEEFGATSVEGYNVSQVAKDLLEGYARICKASVWSDYELHKVSQNVNMRLLGEFIKVYISHSIAYDMFTKNIKRLNIEETAVKPLIQGRDLIKAGYCPSPEMGAKLKELYDLQLQGKTKDELYRGFV